MPTADFLIVGAGIAGASVASELVGDHDVTLLEAEDQPGYHATGRSAAFFSEIYGNATIRALTRASRPFFENPPAGFSESALLTPQDCVFVAGPGEEEDLQARYRELRELTDTVSLESADFAIQRVPVLRPSAVVGCLWERASQRIDVHALLQGYLRAFRRGGGEVITGATVQRCVRDRGAWKVETNRGEFRARVIVNAAGAWADQIAELADVAALNMRPLKRTACLIRFDTRVDVASWAAVSDLRETYYFMPEAGELLLSPADETPTPPGDAWADDVDVAVAVDRFESVTTLSVHTVSHRWAGLRTFSPDRTPVVGFDSTSAGFFWLAGQGGYGIQTAPAMSRLAAALLLDSPIPGDLVAAAKALQPARLRS